ncbi:MAG: hypothetical protein NXI04_04470 [Planctomycetaceae bacterium]|nr:hypothetical protein [Planctomycetaceae bacterium]
MPVASTPAQLSQLGQVFDYHITDGETLTRQCCAQSHGPLDGFEGTLAAELQQLRLPPFALLVLAAAPPACAAWTIADLSVVRRQRALSAGALQGITVGSAVWDTLSLWLERRPDHYLLQVWEDYVGALSWVMSLESLRELQTITGRRCRAVMSAASGCVGIRRFRPANHPLLQRLDRAFCLPAS